MKQLPVLLEPWRPWLSLFPADLAAPLGQLLLRLHPQIGPLRSAPARAEDMPEGVGSIAARGPYERMLISEWAYADAEPDEFIRRAGSGELMFTGPEPAARKRSRRCVALFDAGPAQLGEPRLLHLALFILLARRAEEAGALFEWGILQAPARLHSDSGRDGIQKLLRARTVDGVDADARQAWSGCIDAGADDLWIIGGPALEAPCPARGQVAIRRSMLAEELEVRLTMQRVARQLSLDLPPHNLGTRLLRTPFEPLASAGTVRAQSGRPSLKQPPRFAAYGSSLAVPQLNGSVLVYQIPRSRKNAPGKPKLIPAPSSGNVLAAGVFGKALGYIAGEGATLRFSGFPAEGLKGEAGTCARPELGKFHAPPQMGRWLQTFFIRNKQAGGDGKQEEVHVIVLDLAGNLGCWSSRLAKGKPGTPLAFRLIAQQVIGVVQFGLELQFACARAESTDVYRWIASAGSAQMATIPRTGSRLCFGKPPDWYGGGQRGLVALQCDATQWFVGDGKDWTTATVDSQESVLGVAACTRHAVWGLVVRSANKMTIEIRGYSRHVLVASPEPIAQAALDPATGDIAWIGGKTLRVCVQGIDETRPFLEVVMEGTQHEN